MKRSVVTFTPLRNEQGSTILEAATTLPLFLVIVFFPALDLLLFGYQAIAIQFSVSEGVKRSIPQYAQADDTCSQGIEGRKDCLQRNIQDFATLFGLDLNPRTNSSVSVNICSIEDRNSETGGCSPDSSIGAEGDLVLVDISYAYRPFFLLGLSERSEQTPRVSGRTFVRNEISYETPVAVR